jgi:hypothetical protein
MAIGRGKLNIWVIKITQIFNLPRPIAISISIPEGVYGTYDTQ